MPFPEFPRVVYQKNPLQQVICQLRFAPILRIDSESPTKFQESIRRDYPLLRENREGELQVPTELLNNLPIDLKPLLGPFNKQRKEYSFASLDEQWVVGLSRESISLVTTQYRRWEEFYQHFDNPFQTLLTEYEPVIFTRIGLRYQNLIRRSQIGLEDIAWSELLRPQLAGLLAATDIDPEIVTGTFTVAEMNLAEHLGSVKIRHGFAVDEITHEVCYLIDSDFSTDKVREGAHVTERLREFNLRARRLFRWCITDQLHKAMEPTAL